MDHSLRTLQTVVPRGVVTLQVQITSLQRDRFSIVTTDYELREIDRRPYNDDQLCTVPSVYPPSPLLSLSLSKPPPPPFPNLLGPPSAVSHVPFFTTMYSQSTRQES